MLCSLPEYTGLKVSAVVSGSRESVKDEKQRKERGK